MRRITTIAALACALRASYPAIASPPPPVAASDAWMRATPPGASTGVLYLTLTSAGGDKLVGVSTPAAQSASVHDMRMVGTVMQMRPLEGGLALPPARKVSLSPHGLHVMLEGLKAPLKQGSTVPVHLTFEKAPPVDIAAPVLAIGASGPAGDAMPAMPGMSMEH